MKKPAASSVRSENLQPLDKTGQTPRERFNDYFSKRKPRPEIVRVMILNLHLKKQHENVISAIEAALIHGQSQPWMYEVLALSMELAGRPRKDIERVILSMPDFSGVDFRSMLYSGAYLASFKREKAALRLYQQASRIEPTRPEPYVMALPLAERSKDPQLIGWAASGVLQYAWTANYKQLHRKAEDALVQAKLDLERKGNSEDAEKMHTLLGEAKQRDLILELTWSGDGDVDLSIEEPSGTVCAFTSPQSPGGGVLVHDGYGPVQSNCYEKYVCAFGMPGNYQIKVKHVAGKIVGKRAKLTITRYKGTPQESVKTAVIPLSNNEQLVRVALDHGRRRELAPVPEKQEVSSRVRRRRSNGVRDLIANPDREMRNSGRRFQNGRKQQQVGFQPVVTTLSEGVTMSAMAVISGDRRYVRITTVPSFSTITDVFTFSFIGGNNQNNNQGGNGNGNQGGGGINPNGN